MPKDGHCVDCGSSRIVDASDPKSFERDLKSYKESRDELLAFYDNFVRLFCSIKLGIIS